ncbi:MAG: DUF5011 domain-containing protein [archaeon]|nr:DUF5011 domain-containing protein [archaeon]
MVSKIFSILFLGLFCLSFVSALSIDMTYPQNNVNYDYKIDYINWIFSNSTQAFCFYSLDNGFYYFPIDCNAQTVNGFVSNENTNEWRLKINGTEGSFETNITSFWVDSLEPQLDYVTPSSQVSYTNLDSFNFQFWLNESNKESYSGVNFAPFSLNVYDPTPGPFPFSAPELINLSSSIITLSELYNLPIPLGNREEGNYNWIVFAKDKYPNGVVIREVNLTGIIIRDVTNPLISILNPLNGQYVLEDVQIDVLANDSLSGLNSINLSISNLTGYTNNALSCDLSELCSRTWDSTEMADGTATITAIAYDKAGNTNATSITVEIDNTAPTISFDAPTDFNWTALDQTIEISAVDAHLNNITIYVNGTIANSTNSDNLTLSYTLTDSGIYEVFANATDSFGHSNVTEDRTIKIDKEGPSSFSDYDGSWQKKDFNITLSADDFGLSGVAYINYSYNGTNGQIAGSSGLVSINAEGNLSLVYYAVDNVGNIGAVYTIYVALDKTPPAININGNISLNHEVKTSYIELGATVSDDLNSSEILLNINSSSLNVNVLGFYNVTYTATDEAGNIATANRTINVVDTVVPTIDHLIGLNPQTIELGSNYSSQELGAVAIDNYDGIISGNIIVDSSEIDNLVEETYNVYYNVQDSSGNNASQSIRTVYVRDNVKPLIEILLIPENKHAYIDGTLFNFIFNVTDLSDISNCSLYLDESEYFLESLNNLWNVSISGLTPGLYSWYTNCSDNSLVFNTKNSETRTFTILANNTEESEFNDYTNLGDEEDISNVSGFYVINQYGIINFTGGIDFSSGFDWSQFINLSTNSVYVNTSEDGINLNKPAIITMYNLTWTNPQILRNGVVCSSLDCVILQWDATVGTLNFSVTGFSEYTTGETPVAPLAAPAGGGGGGIRLCTTTWECGDWSVCENGLETRSCFKEDSTCDAGDKPLEEQTCGIEITPDTTEEEVANNGLGVTGSVIGGLFSNAKVVWAIVIIVLILILVLVVLFLRKRAKSEDFANKIKVDTSVKSV